VPTNETSPPRLLQASQAVLLIVDLQEKFAAALDDFDRVVDRTAILMQACRPLGIPIVVSEQYPQGLGHTVATLKNHLPPDATVWEKTAFGCGQDPHILAHVTELQRPQVMVCGLESHVCVNQTVHQLLVRSFQVHLIQDAVTARHKHDHKTALAKMQQSGAIPSCVEMALFELLGDARHPDFKALQALIK
jgi:nicotinamidase-related amidase